MRLSTSRIFKMRFFALLMRLRPKRKKMAADHLVTNSNLITHNIEMSIDAKQRKNRSACTFTVLPSTSQTSECINKNKRVWHFCEAIYKYTE